MNNNNSGAQFQPDKVLSHFKAEWKVLLLVTISGLIYNIGLLAGPWFEGKMTGSLVDILSGAGQFSDMLILAVGYVIVIAIVQISRYIKRFYVRRFSNNVNRRMKEILYGSLVRKSRTQIKEEGEGNVMTKAILDVDDCVEGMRKFTTEIFDTGVALTAYAAMLFVYDWRLALLCLIFPPISYITAEKMKKMIQRTGAAYKRQSGALSAATLDRAENAITYRVFGQEKERQMAYEKNLSDYEKSAIKANIWNTSMPPVYRVISMAGILFILYFGQKNILGTGWKSWTIAAFTTYLSCFMKLSVKSSSAAKLFNAVHKAQVSWKRIKPFLTVQKEADGGRTDEENSSGESLKSHKSDHKAEENSKIKQLKVSHLSFAYPDGKEILNDISFTAEEGQIIGITGAVACGKSTLGKAFLCEYPYEGQIFIGNRELSSISPKERTQMIGYLGHDAELFNDTVENNILMGENKNPDTFLQAVCMSREVEEMKDEKKTFVGNGGVRLSGGQGKRLALARTLCHERPVLILDDPFSALDKKTETEIFANLKEMTKENIVILISHRLYLFPQMDKVIWMENGKALAGTHEELMHIVPEYKNLFMEQSEEGTEKTERKKAATEKSKTEGEICHEK